MTLPMVIRGFNDRSVSDSKAKSTKSLGHVASSVGSGEEKEKDGKITEEDRALLDSIKIRELGLRRHFLYRNYVWLEPLPTLK